MTLTDRVCRAVARVTDPELLDVTIDDLGVLDAVRVDEERGRVEVDLIPTFSGCPALGIMQQDVEQAARAIPGVEEVQVRFRADRRWSPSRITVEGRRKLADGLTIAVQDAAGELACPVCGSPEVAERSPFGPTACRAVAYCDSCRNPVEVIRQ